MQLSGEELYELFTDANNEQDISIDDWDKLDDYDRETWNRVAEMLHGFDVTPDDETLRDAARYREVRTWHMEELRSDAIMGIDKVTMRPLVQADFNLQSMFDAYVDISIVKRG